ncbi:hypothetical protein [Pseudomonas sp. NPDC086251]|uniref:hypothetical protein n=1 Tax=Pseudomonas sp. NPDC086251 TaxID=3364431 RepID=UPI003836E80F
MSNTPHETLITIDKVELDLWADIYCKARLASLIDVTLSEFLQRPYEFLKESGPSVSARLLGERFLSDDAGAGQDFQGYSARVGG